MEIDHLETLVTADVVKMLGVATSTVTTMVNEGRIPAVKSGGIWIFRKDVLDEWESSGRPREEESPELFAKARSFT